MENKTLKDHISNLNNLLEGIKGFKNYLNGSVAMAENANLEEEAKLKAEAELKEKEEKEKAEAELKAKAEAEAAQAAKDEKETEEQKKKELADKEAEEKEKAKAELEAAEKAKAEEEAKAKEEAEAALKNTGLNVNDVELKEKHEKIAKTESMKKAVCAEDLADLDLTDSEKALATQYSFVELVKMASALSSEVASFKEEKAKAEAAAMVDSRYNELVNLGIAVVGAKASEQKAKVSNMDEKAFAYYKEELITMKENFTNPDLEKEIQKAKEAAGNKSVAANLDQAGSQYDLYKLF